MLFSVRQEAICWYSVLELQFEKILCVQILTSFTIISD